VSKKKPIKIRKKVKYPDEFSAAGGSSGN